MDLNTLVIFARVVESESFSEAARRLDIPVSTVSRKISELESDLGVRLLERSTRQLRLTDIGRKVYTHAQLSLDLKDTINNVVSNQLTSTQGALVLSSPPNISDSLVAPLVSAFQTEYPKVTIRVLVTERFVDLISEGVDMSFRVGQLQDSALYSRPFLRYRHQLVACPEYLNKHPEPQHPNELHQHRLLAFSYWSPQFVWNLRKANNDSESCKFVFKPDFAINDYSGIAHSLVAAGGIGDLPPIVAPWLLEEKKLVEVMPQWQFPAVDISMVHLSNRHLPKALRLFKEFVTDSAPNLFNNLPC